MTDITYSIVADTANGLVEPTTLSNEIIASGLPQAEKIDTLGDILTISHTPALSVPQSGTLDGVVAAHSGINFSTVDAPGPTGDIIQEAIDVHASDPSAHHVRYTDAEAIAASSGALDHHVRYTDAEAIAASSGALDHHVRYTDAEASGVAVQVVTTGIANHTSNADAHHTRYTDAEAIAASSGALDHHLRYTDAEASGVAVQVVTTGIADHAAVSDAHHARYTDIEAIAAASGALDHHARYTDAEVSGIAIPITIAGIAIHAADVDAHHVRYTDAEAIAAASGALDHHTRYTDAEASGVAVQVVTTGISNHAANADAHHTRYTDAEAITAASGALDHHTRYTDSEASGVAVQVVTTGIANHAANADAHHTRYTDAEAITAATGNVTLQTAYDAGGSPPHVIESLSRGTFTIRGVAGSDEIFALQDSAGVTQHRWNNESIFMGPTVGSILSASISGINLSPALFPTRPTVNFTLDQLNLLPTDRTLTSNFVKISFSSTYTLDFPSASFGAALGLNATILLRQNGGAFGMGLLFNNAITWSNDVGFAANLGAAFSFVDQPTYRADGQAITQGLVRSMISQPRIMTINGGTLALTTLQHYFAGGQILAGATVGTRVVFDAFNVAPFTGSITTEHIGFRIGNLSDGGGGATIHGIQSNMNNGLFIVQLGTAPSEHGPEFRIGSTLAHIGDLDTNIAFTTDQFDINCNGVNMFRAFSNGAADFVSVNPGLNDIDFFVNGDTGTLIRTNAAIDGLGFHGVTAVALSPAYTVTNGAVDRAYNANATTLDELADVVGTVIADLQAKGLLG